MQLDRYARTLQQRHISKARGNDSQATSRNSGFKDDYEYFEFLNAAELQEICAKQLLGHMQRYEVYWRIKLEGSCSLGGQSSDSRRAQVVSWYLSVLLAFEVLPLLGRVGELSLSVASRAQALSRTTCWPSW